MRTSRAALVLVAVLVVACQAASPAPATSPGAAATPAQGPTDIRPSPGSGATPVPPAGQTGIEWRQVGIGRDVGVLRVPLDYEEPDGRQVTVALARHRATDPAHRIGTLLYLDGGPGGLGTVTLRNAADVLFPQAVLERFDIVAFDPRGAGHSVPAIDCPLDPAPSTWDPSKGRAMLPAWLATVRDEVAACATASGDVLPFLGTRNTVRDVEQIRQALGAERISLYGGSYGTLVGSLYADRYPDAFRALVLNAPVDPAGDFAEKSEVAMAAFQRELDAFLAACSEDRACPFWSRDGSRSAYDRLMTRFAAGPIGDVTNGEAMTAVTYGLYAEDRTGLASALAAARDGDAGALEAAMPGWLDEDFTGYNAAVNCLDESVPRDADAYAELMERLARVAPDFAWAVGWGPACIFWPVDPQPITEPVTASGAPPILILASTGDPATPYEGAISLSRELASSVLVTYDGSGHGANGACIDRIVEAYLVGLTLPSTGTVCR